MAAGGDIVITQPLEVSEAMLSAEAVYLRLEDVDTFCDVRVNGNFVGSTSNRFRRWEWDVKPFLHAGENVLEGTFHDAETISEQMYDALEHPVRMGGVGFVPHLNLIRKPIYQGGWDWGPKCMYTGFAGKVELIPVNVARLDYITCSQEHSKRKCELTVTAEVTSPKGGETDVEFRCGGAVKKMRVKFPAGTSKISETFVINRPQLWWPAGMGEQPLYHVSVKMDGQSLTKKVGLRTFTVGQNLLLKVNGRRVVAKGANWIPCDTTEAGQTRERYLDLLTSARDANMNMVRLWGGGKYENDAFYEICDSLGLLIWHDFMFCCAMYPTDSTFMGEVSAEIAHQIKRLQSHPSIALWCGDNEGMDCFNWRMFKKDPEYYKKEYKRLVDLRGDLVSSLDPARTYWPTSPCGGPGDYDTNGWNDDSKGDMHLWSVSKSARPLEEYYKYRPRFMSEFGHSSFTSLLPSLDEQRAHIREGGGWDNILERIALHFNMPTVISSEGRKAGVEKSLIYFSQIEQALGLETAASWWRALPECNGILVWQLNDIWPGSSWATLEYDGSWKPAHYHLKRVFAREVITAEPDGDYLRILTTGYGQASVTLWTFSGEKLWTSHKKSYEMSEFGTPEERRGRFLQLELPGAAPKTWFFAEPKDCFIEPADVKLSTSERDGRLVAALTTDKPAFFVWLTAAPGAARFSDNSFTLLPGETKEVVVISNDPSVISSEVEKSLSVTHLAVESSPRRETLLRDWAFHLGEAEGAQAPGFDDSAWESVRVPHDWAITGPFSADNDSWNPGRTGGLPWVGVGWYRTTFSVPAGKKASLLFDGAMSHATVYVNGKEIYSWPNGYSAVPIDISDAVEPGKTNTLAVRLETLPESSRWYPGAGLYRNVHLITTDPVHIPVWGTYVTTPEVSATSATVRVETTVDGADGRSVEVVTTIIDKEGNVVISSEGRQAEVEKSNNEEISPRASLGRNDKEGIGRNDKEGLGRNDKEGLGRNDKASGIEFTINNPLLWSPEEPNLYRAVSEVFADGKKVDEYVTTFGIRKAEFIDGKGFFLNGKPMKFNGVCMHHDMGPIGAAVSVPALRHQLEILKDMGCNAIRTSHNQPAPELVRLCDEMGFMMMVEAFDEWRAGKCPNGYHTIFDDWAEKDLTNMIAYFRNDPAVILWSTGNEVCRDRENVQQGLEEAKMLTAICHREDPTRPVTLGLDTWTRFLLSQEWRDSFDVIGLNYHTWKYLELKEVIGDRLILGSETGSTVSSRGVYHLPAVKQRDMSQSPDRQCSSYDLESCKWSNDPDCDLAMHQDYPWAIGQFVWTGFDYLGEPTPYEGDWPNHSSMFGIVDLASIPKDRFYLFRSVWNTADHTLHLLPHWNWSAGDVVPVFVYTDAPSAELFLNGKSLGVQTKEISPRASLGRNDKESLGRNDNVVKSSKSSIISGTSSVISSGGKAGVEKSNAKAGTAPLTRGDREENVEARFRLRWDVPFEAGELMAVSLSADGQPVDTTFVRTAGKPYGIKLEYDERRLKADGEDLAYVTVSIVDAAGNLCPKCRR
ncbi:MAG: DUF4982 domain-containing protein, partial [Bacteroidales bacterium]|nr:DUF4982 domain-containing protein [Bacteroidales bacterium]